MNLSGAIIKGAGFSYATAVGWPGLQYRQLCKTRSRRHPIQRLRFNGWDFSNGLTNTSLIGAILTNANFAHADTANAAFYQPGYYLNPVTHDERRFHRRESDQRGSGLDLSGAIYRTPI